MTLRLLHLADLHLDTVVGGRTEAIRSRARGAMAEAFERALELAVEHDVHAVLVAGDAFDDPLLSHETAERFRSGLRRVADAGLDVAWCTGNHDPGAKQLQGKMGRATLLGLHEPARFGHPRIHVFRNHVARTVALRGRASEPAGTLTSIGHRTHGDAENLALKLHRPVDPLPAAAMLHTQVEGARGAAEHRRYAPCSAADLAAAGFDYWALGHVHVRGRVPGAPAWYAGIPQGRNAKESGARGALIVELDTGEPPRVEPIDLSSLRFESLSLTGLAALDRPEALAARIAEELRPFADSPADVVLRVELHGACPLAPILRRPEERRELEQRLALDLRVLDCELAVERVHAPRDLADFHGTPSALREAHRLLEAAAGDDALALALGDVPLSHEAPPPGDPRRAAYLRECLAGLGDSLVERAFAEELR